MVARSVIGREDPLQSLDWPRPGRDTSFRDTRSRIKQKRRRYIRDERNGSFSQTSWPPFARGLNKSYDLARRLRRRLLFASVKELGFHPANLKYGARIAYTISLPLPFPTSLPKVGCALSDLNRVFRDNLHRPLDERTFSVDRCSARLREQWTVKRRRKHRRFSRRSSAVSAELVRDKGDISTEIKMLDVASFRISTPFIHAIFQTNEILFNRMNTLRFKIIFFLLFHMGRHMYKVQSQIEKK